eukprot:TRINITY_DN101618_c0_g1_i1.p1 TRINITY_DN101618_c0_g1~~TRINITY_DN101618_c0_g1_i1.p1  ORF type:complete len:676 (-),score=122.25 TRINITY_DN101618_c0_g1_i1:168-2195(-)
MWASRRSLRLEWIVSWLRCACFAFLLCAQAADAWSCPLQAFPLQGLLYGHAVTAEGRAGAVEDDDSSSERRLCGNEPYFSQSSHAATGGDVGFFKRRRSVAVESFGTAVAVRTCVAVATSVLLAGVGRRPVTTTYPQKDRKVRRGGSDKSKPVQEAIQMHRWDRTALWSAQPPPVSREPAEAVIIRKKKNPYIPQAQRYRSVDWFSNLVSLPNSGLLYRIRRPVSWMGFSSVCWWCLYLVLKPQGLFPSLGMRAHLLLGSALGLLLVFRTNTAYSRFWEGRRIWEQILDVGRDLTRATVLYTNQLGPDTSAKICRLVQAFPFCMIEHLRGKADPKLRSKLDRLLRSDVGHEGTIITEYELPLSANRPLFIINHLANAINQAANDEAGLWTNRERGYFFTMVDKLSATIGACERLVQTPVPLSYVRHTSRFLSLFMLSLPWAVIEEVGFLTVPLTLFVAWALFGILEIGLVIEDPFQGVIKLEVVADTLEQDIAETRRFIRQSEASTSYVRHERPREHKQKQEKPQQTTQDLSEGENSRGGDTLDSEETQDWKEAADIVNATVRSVVAGVAVEAVVAGHGNMEVMPSSKPLPADCIDDCSDAEGDSDSETIKLTTEVKKSEGKKGDGKKGEAKKGEHKAEKKREEHKPDRKNDERKASTKGLAVAAPVPAEEPLQS